MPGIMLTLFGLAIVVFGIAMRQKKKYKWVSLHSNVKPENIEVFSRMNGQCIVGVGLAVICLGLFFAIGLIPVGAILFLVGMIISLTIFFAAQRKYKK